MQSADSVPTFAARIAKQELEAHAAAFKAKEEARNAIEERIL